MVIAVQVAVITIVHAEARHALRRWLTSASPAVGLEGVRSEEFWTDVNQ
jgi:hypothetical protein